MSWFFKCFDGVRLQKLMPAFRYHDRIHYEGIDSELLEFTTHGSHNRSGRQHPGFNRSDFKILKDGVDLRFNDTLREVINGPHAFGVLRCDGGNHGHGKSAIGRHSLQVGLDPCPPARIRPCNGKDLFGHEAVHVG